MHADPASHAGDAELPRKCDVSLIRRGPRGSLHERVGVVRTHVLCAFCAARRSGICVGCGMLSCFYSWEAVHGGNGDGKGCGGGRGCAWDGWRLVPELGVLVTRAIWSARWRVLGMVVMAILWDLNSLGIIYSSVQVLVFRFQISYALHVISSPQLDRAITPARRNEPRIVRDICSQHSLVVTCEALA